MQAERANAIAAILHFDIKFLHANSDYILLCYFYGTYWYVLHVN